MSKPKKLTRLQTIAILQRELASEREETKFLRATLTEIKECLEDKSKRRRVKRTLRICDKGLADAVSRFLIMDCQRIEGNITKALAQASPFMALLEKHRAWTSTSTIGL